MVFGIRAFRVISCGKTLIVTGSPGGDYLEKNILEHNPFETMDASGVGQLVEIAVEKGRSVKPKLKCGICGEHGGDPASINFFATVKLDYISCSPFRVPVARLAAAQAALLTQQLTLFS